MLLFFVLACDTLHPLPRPLRRGRRASRPRRRSRWAWLEAIILTIITASTPLLLAALGELVAERSGVLNLGVEGMMVDRRGLRLRRRLSTPASPLLGVARGDRSPAWLMASLFGFLTLVWSPTRSRPGWR